MNTVREIQRINEQELQRGIAGTTASWHAKYASSAWIFCGNLDHALTEGDLLCVLSQYGELDDVHLVRNNNDDNDVDNGKSRGFAFAKYQDARSCVLAVDNFCGVELCGRTLRVDHVENYRLPQNLQQQQQQQEGSIAENDVTRAGQAYRGQEMANQYSLTKGQDLFAPQAATRNDEDSNDDDDDDDKKNKKQAKQQRKQERQRKREEKEKRKKEKIKSAKEDKKREKRARKLHRDKNDTNDSDEHHRRHHSKKHRYDSQDDSSS